MKADKRENTTNFRILDVSIVMLMIGIILYGYIALFVIPITVFIIFIALITGGLLTLPTFFYIWIIIIGLCAILTFTRAQKIIPKRWLEL